MKDKKQDFSFQIMVIDSKKNELLFDMYFKTIDQAKSTYDCILVSGVRPGITLELYFRYYYYYDRDPQNIVEVCEHELIEKNTL